MNWCKGNEIEWKEIIETVSREQGLSNLMVEKDTIQSMFLMELSKSDLPFVFKGGTSLSKVYGLIDRFSEDIDLSMNRKPTEKERRLSKQTIIEIAEYLGMQLSNPDSVKSRHDYNKYVFLYPSLFTNRPMEIIIETSYYQTVYPVERHAVHSYVGDFCREKNIVLPIPFEAAGTAILVQSLQRTFVDKVFAVCYYRLQEIKDRESRHLYDICKLLERIELNRELDVLIDKVRVDRMASKNHPAAALEHNIPEMLREMIESHFFEGDYKTITQKLLYKDMSYEDAIKHGIAILAESDIFLYKRD